MTVAINGVGSITGLIVPFSSAYRATTAQALTSATLTPVLFNAEDVDTLSNFNTSTGQFTCSVAGLYLVSWVVFLQSSAGVGSTAYSAPTKNGPAYRRGVQFSKTAGDISALGTCGSLVMQLAPGDVLGVSAELVFASGTGSVLQGKDLSGFDVALINRT
jgi:hypothetical protein